MCWSPESPLKVPWRSRTLGPLGDLRDVACRLGQEMEKQVTKDKELERLKNKASKLRKEANKEYYGYGIIPPIYPTKMLISLIKLLTRIYEGYTSKQVVNKTKRLLNTLYNNKIITETVYNHLANI